MRDETDLFPMSRAESPRVRWWIVLTIIAILAATAYQLRYQGRLWLCSCGYFLFWTSDAWTADNSQHLSDPYSFTHILHGFAFCGLLAWSLPQVGTSVRLGIAVAAEAAWEIIENTNFVIQRYREATAALGYQGDTVVNSLGDIMTCALGFLIAWRLGLKWTLILFFLVEAMLLIWIRDSLILNIVMLVYPLEVIRSWQANF